MSDLSYYPHTPKPPRFYCWDCGHTFVIWPDERGHVYCKWCQSHDVSQMLPRVTHGGRASVEAHKHRRAELADANKQRRAGK